MKCEPERPKILKDAYSHFWFLKYRTIFGDCTLKFTVQSVLWFFLLLTGFAAVADKWHTESFEMCSETHRSLLDWICCSILPGSWQYFWAILGVCSMNGLDTKCHVILVCHCCHRFHHLLSSIKIHHTTFNYLYDIRLNSCNRVIYQTILNYFYIY